jgi:flagellar motor protein MotB
LHFLKVCCKDLWYLEVGPPPQAARVQLIRASTTALELSWTSIPNAQYYILEVQKLPPAIINEKPVVPLKEEAEAKPVLPKITYQPSAAGDKKPMIILQPKKSLQLPSVRAPSVFKVMHPGSTTISSASQIKVVQKPTFVSAPTGNTIRPAFTGNVIKLMPGAILSGNKIIMKPATSGTTVINKPTTSQQIIIQRPATPTAIKLNTVQTPRIVVPTSTGTRPITIGGRTVTLQLAPGQKKVTLVGAPAGSSTPKIIMMPATSTANTNTTTVHQHQSNQQIEQLDGNFEMEQLDGAVDQEDDIESQISTVKIEKQQDGEDVKVTTSGVSTSSDKMEENEAAAILSTIGEVSHLSSHSVNTHIPMHDEK